MLQNEERTFAALARQWCHSPPIGTDLHQRLRGELWKRAALSLAALGHLAPIISATLLGLESCSAADPCVSQVPARALEASEVAR